MDFKQELKNLYEGHTITIDGIEKSVATGTEKEIVDLMAAEAGAFGVQFKHYHEGVLEFVARHKAQVTMFVGYLDDNDNVETYEIEARIPDNQKDLYDDRDTNINDIIDNEYVSYDIYVILNPEIVHFDAVYYADTTNSTEFDVSDIDQNGDGYIYVDDNVEVITEASLPFIAKKLKTHKSKANGKITVSLDKSKSDPKLFVYVNYDKEADTSDIEEDLKFINSGKLTSDFSKYFTLEKPAKYLDKTKTFAAVYKIKPDTDINALLEEIINESEYFECDYLYEVIRKIKVNARGVKRIKMQCQPGFKYNSERRTCEKITGSQMATMRFAHIKMSRTKKSLGSSYKKRIVMKGRKANRFRKSMGLK